MKNEDNSDESNASTELLSSSSFSTTSSEDGFPSGCQFSPDGLCILTSESNRLLLYNTTTKTTKGDIWKPAIQCQSGDSVRSYAWYPHMKSNDPASCCFAGVSRDQPVHLYDAYTGEIRATYRPYNRLDELESPTTLCFSNNGQQIVTGGFRSERMLQIFDLNQPGRDASANLKLGKTKRSKDGQKGLVSALCSSSAINLLAVGTYSPGSIYLYDARAQSTQVAEVVISGTCVVGHGKSHSRKRKHFVHDGDDDEDAVDFSAAKIKWLQNRARGGVTQVEFSQDGMSLFSSSRRSNAILQWDLRKLTSSTFCPCLTSFETDNDTNQRIGFSLHDDYLYAAGRDNCIRIYDLKQSDRVVTKMDSFDDVVNGVSQTCLGAKSLVVCSIGSRQFPTDADFDEEENSLSEHSYGGCLQLYDITLNNVNS